MDGLVRAAWVTRRAARRVLPLATACAVGALAVFDASSPLTPVAAGAAVVVWAAVLAMRAGPALWHRKADAWLGVDLGTLLGGAALAAMGRVEGGPRGEGYAALYALVAGVSAFAPPLATATVVAYLIGVEGLVRCFGLGERDLGELSVHAGLLFAFASASLIFLRVEVTRARRSARAQLEREIARLHESARSYRLVAAPSSSAQPSAGRPADDERLARSSVEEIRQAVLLALDLLRRSLDLRTALLVWLNDGGTHARITELSTDADDVVEGPFFAGDGLLGAVVSRRAPVTLEGLKAGYKLPYYSGPCPVRVACGVPVVEGGHVRGVLLVDRVEARPFDVPEIELLCSAARFAVRAVENERVLLQLERSKVEQSQLYRAAEALGAARNEADVVEAGVESARRVAEFDFAAVTLFDERSGMHEIRAVSGDDGKSLVGARFAHSQSLCSMVVESRHPLPYKGDFDPERQVVFTRRLAPPKLPAILVLPLLVHDRPLGTLVLGARRRGAFGEAVQPTLEVLASLMAVSLANARMLRKLEELATTDGLTGLLNKRAMLEVASQKLAAATRHGRKLAVLITDIDHFKKVNDAHGHDVGDHVIRGLADVLRRARRSTDAVGRFGGEEFVVVCEEIDAKGAMLLAERIRTEFEATEFETREGVLRVTCSVGLSTWPEAGVTWESLFKAADEALYVSKRSGRNRSTVWAARRGEPTHKPGALPGSRVA